MKRSYLDQLTRAARWRLPPAEAQEVVEDYTAMLAEEPREEEALRREVGEPVQAVRELTQWKSYLRWLAMFAGLIVCLLLPLLASFPGMHRLWSFFVLNGGEAFWAVLFLLGGLTGVVLLRRQGAGKAKLPKGVLPLLIFQSIGIVGLWWLGSTCIQKALDAVSSGMLSPDWPHAYAWLTGVRVWVLCTVLLGVAGLVKYRLTDRRWLAVYMLGLTAAVLGMTVLSLMGSLNLEGITPAFCRSFLVENAVVTALGLVGTGMALCYPKEKRLYFS